MASDPNSTFTGLSFTAAMRRLIREELARLFPEASAEALLREGGKPSCDHANRSDDGTGTMRCDACGSVRAELTPYKKSVSK